MDKDTYTSNPASLKDEKESLKDKKKRYLNPSLYAAGESGVWATVIGTIAGAMTFCAFLFYRKSGNFIDRTAGSIEKSFRTLEVSLAKFAPEKYRANYLKVLEEKHRAMSAPGATRVEFAINAAAHVGIIVTMLAQIPFFFPALQKAKKANQEYEEVMQRNAQLEAKNTPKQEQQCPNSAASEHSWRKSVNTQSSALGQDATDTIKR